MDKKEINNNLELVGKIKTKVEELKELVEELDVYAILDDGMSELNVLADTDNFFEQIDSDIAQLEVTLERELQDGDDNE